VKLLLTVGLNVNSVVKIDEMPPTPKTSRLHKNESPPRTRYKIPISVTPVGRTFIERFSFDRLFDDKYIVINSQGHRNHRGAG
jgi:hypothetical protein